MGRQCPLCLLTVFAEKRAEPCCTGSLSPDCGVPASLSGLGGKKVLRRDREERDQSRRNVRNCCPRTESRRVLQLP